MTDTAHYSRQAAPAHCTTAILSRVHLLDKLDGMTPHVEKLQDIPDYTRMNDHTIIINSCQVVVCDYPFVFINQRVINKYNRYIIFLKSTTYFIFRNKYNVFSFNQNFLMFNSLAYGKFHDPSNNFIIK